MAPYNSNGNGSAPTADDHTLANLLTTMAQQQPLPKKRGSNAAGARSSERTAAAPSSKKGGANSKKNADETSAATDKNADSPATAKVKTDSNKTNGTGSSTRNLSASIATQQYQQAPQPPTWNGRTGSAAQASTTINPSATVGTTNANATASGRNDSRASSENQLDADYSEDNDESYTANATAASLTAATNGKGKGKKNQARAAKKEASFAGALSGSTGNANASTSAAGAAVNGNGPTAAAANADDEEGGEKLHTKQEWNRTRKDNHKEVERRRRETINEGINELKNIVPGCEKNKGSILSRAVQYIQQLKDKEANLIEKWTLEKLLSDQTTSDLKREVEKLREELSIARMLNGKRGEVDGGRHHAGSEHKRSRLEGR